MPKLSESCLYYREGRCRSCDLIDMSPEDYNKKKQSHYSKSLVLGPNYLQSRNKAKLVVSGTTESPILGLYDKELLHCPLHLPLINDLAEFLLPKITEYKLTPYDIQNRKGELKYFIIFVGKENKTGMLRFVMRSKEALERVQKLTPLIQKQFPMIKVVSLNLQPEHTSIIEGQEEIILSSDKTITDELADLKFVLGPKTFYQVNSPVAEKLYLKARSLSQEIKPKTILDLFCGIGTFAQFCARNAERVVGVELSQESIDYAHESAKLNQLTNCEFHAMDVKKFLDKEKDFKADLIIVNPPRRGLGADISELLLKLSPEHIFYSSCNPDTLASDLLILTKDYEVMEETPFDMFSLTSHLEVFCVLRKIHRGH